MRQYNNIKVNLINPNDKTAHIYDLVNAPLKGEEVTGAEIELIKSLCSQFLYPKQKCKILDVGCGTGRHAIPLAKLGYEVTGMDSSKEMLETLKEKAEKAGVEVKVICADLLKSEMPGGKFDLMILMWNAFNEMVHNEEQAIALLKKLKGGLKKGESGKKGRLSTGGKILINVDDSQKMNLRDLNFKTENKIGGCTYKQSWKVLDLDEDAKTTVSEEKISVIDEQGHEIASYTSEIKQTWWCRDSIKKLAKIVGMKMEEKKIKENEEVYFVLN